jgi:hypothetical protein
VIFSAYHDWSVTTVRKTYINYIMRMFNVVFRSIYALE